MFRRDLWCRRRHNKLRSVLTNSAFGHWLPWYDVTYLGFRSLYPVGSSPSLVTVLPNVVGPIWQHSTLLPPSQALVDQRHCFYHCWKHQWRCLFGTVQYGQPLFGTVQYGQPLFVIPVAPCVRRQCSWCFIFGKKGNQNGANQTTGGTGSCFVGRPKLPQCGPAHCHGLSPSACYVIAPDVSADCSPHTSQKLLVSRLAKREKRPMDSPLAKLT